MKALLDTHAFLWAIIDEPKLSRRAQRVFTGPSDLWLSVASLWEILIKVQAGKLPLPSPTACSGTPPKSIVPSTLPSLASITVASLVG